MCSTIRVAEPEDALAFPLLNHVREFKPFVKPEDSIPPSHELMGPGGRLVWTQKKAGRSSCAMACSAQSLW